MEFLEGEKVQQIIEALQSSAPTLIAALKSIGNITALVLEFFVDLIRRLIGGV